MEQTTDDAVAQIRKSIKDIMEHGGKKYSINVIEQGWQHISLTIFVALTRIGYDCELTGKGILHVRWDV